MNLLPSNERAERTGAPLYRWITMRILTISVLLSAVLFQSCATGPLKSELKDIRQVNAPKLAKLKIGTSLEDFQAVFPEAYPAGQNGDTTGYESRLEQKYIDDAD